MRSLTLLVLFCLAPVLRAQEEASEQRPPNVILILADDLGYGEIGRYGQKKIRTPHLNRLYDQGMHFTRAYSGAPVCAPSRCVLMTGVPTTRAAIRDNREVRPEGQAAMPAGTPTIASHLKAAGWRTGAMGKWGLGAIGSASDPNAAGFEIFFGYNCQREAHNFFPPWLWLNREKVWLDNPRFRAHQRAASVSMGQSEFRGTQYAPDLMLEQARAFLRVEDPRPFFLYLPFVEPHLAMQPPPEWVERYPEEWDEKPYLGTKGYLPHPRPRAGYAAMISDLDEHVGSLMALLEELGMADDTIVMFTSDNGPTHDVGGVDTTFFNSAGGLRGRKGSVYEGGLRVPLIVRWPGVTGGGRRSTELVAAEDFLPTMLDLAGIETPGPTPEARSFLGALRGEDLPDRAPIVHEFHGYGGQQAVIGERYKLVRRDLKRKVKPFELYDLKGDVLETTDLAASMPELVRELAAHLDRRTPSKLFPLPLLDD